MPCHWHICVEQMSIAFAHCCIVFSSHWSCNVQLEGYKYAGDDTKKDIRMRFFHTHQNIHPNHVFQPVVSPPTADDRKPRVDWTEFHTVLPVDSLDSNHSGHLEELAGLWRTSGQARLVTCICYVCCASCAFAGLWSGSTPSLRIQELSQSQLTVNSESQACV